MNPPVSYQFPTEIKSFLHDKQTILVGTSGGRDSIALLTLLHHFTEAHLVVCHINHQLRPEADSEENFVRNVAEAYQLSFLSTKQDVKERAEEKKISIELAAREARQEAFYQWAQLYDTPVIALAHHQDDQAETILLHLFRGSAGLRGMTPVSRWQNGLTIIRPLLEITRKAITTYLEDHNISWIDDHSNDSHDYTRNRIRHQVLPLLNNIFNRDVTATLTRSCLQENSNHKALNQAIQHLDVLDKQERLYLPKFNSYPIELQKAILHDFLRLHQVSDISSECIQRVLSIIPTGNPSKTNLPGGRYATRKEKRLIISTYPTNKQGPHLRDTNGGI